MICGSIASSKKRCPRINQALFSWARRKTLAVLSLRRAPAHAMHPEFTMQLFRVSGRMLFLAMVVAGAAPSLLATPDQADHSVDRFLARATHQADYRGTRRLEAENGNRRGWLDVTTEYAPETGFRYQIVAEGGADSIRKRVLKAVLDGERAVVAAGEDTRSALARTNYNFQPNGFNDDGLAQVLLSPRRKERALVAGVMLLRPDEGELVRVEGRLAKNPSFWVRNVHIVRQYERIGGVVVPVTMDSRAHVRFLGAATFRMTYRYSEINGHPVE